MKLLIGALFCLLSLFASAETLKDVLERNHIPTSTFKQADLEAKVSSGVEQRLGDLLFLAYPSLSQDGVLSSPIRVVQFGGFASKVLYRQLVSAEISDECVGSILHVDAVAGKVLIQTHINPSAGCTIVLDEKLTPQNIVMGWPIARVGSSGVILEENQVHFMPVHPLRLRMLDILSGVSSEVYPPEGDVLRRRYFEQLQKVLPPEKWCQENNNPCHSKNFGQQIRYGPDENGAGTSFGFVVSYEPEGFGEKAENEVGTWFALYIYRKAPKGWQYCVRNLPDNEVDEVGASLRPNFDGATKSCTVFLSVKVTPVDSPFSRFEKTVPRDRKH